MSSYKVVLKPGGVGGRNVGIGIKLAKKPLLSPEEIAALSAVVPVSTSLEVTVIYPVGMTGASVRITGPDAFDQTIVNTMMFDPITAGDYIIVAAAVAGHTVRVFTSPKSVPEGGKTCAMVIYDLAGTGGGGDCTPTCPINGFRFLPLGTHPIAGPAENSYQLNAIPDSEFTEDANDFFLRQIYPRDFLPRCWVYCRFFGQLCDNSIIEWSVNSDPVIAHSSGFAYFKTHFFSIGNTAACEIEAQTYLSSTTGDRELGIVSFGVGHYVNNGTSLTNVCESGLSCQLFVRFDFGQEEGG